MKSANSLRLLKDPDSLRVCRELYFSLPYNHYQMGCMKEAYKLKKDSVWRVRVLLDRVPLLNLITKHSPRSLWAEAVCNQPKPCKGWAKSNSGSQCRCQRVRVNRTWYSNNNSSLTRKQVCPCCCLHSRGLTRWFPIRTRSAPYSHIKAIRMWSHCRRRVSITTEIN